LAAAALGLTLLLQGCGGGSVGIGLSTSTITVPNAQATQVAQGVVTGFGSVFVDGVELEDADASVTKENYDGSTSNTLLQMGQRVRATHDGNGKASKVTLDAAVIGTVSAIDLTANTLTVAGQKVNVVTSTTAGTLTVWGGGFTTISDVSAGALVEVHGTPVYDSTSKTYSVTASRIQKVTEQGGRMQVAGTISALNTTAKTFAINGLTVNYTTAALRPSTATLADGNVVTAFAPLTALSGSTLTASHLKVHQLQDSTVAVSRAQIGGQVSKFNSTSQSFEVQGIKITIGSTTTINPSTKSVADGAFVNVTGTVGTDGSITATNIQIREQSTSSDLATVRLIGVISDFVDNTSFVVRGIPVDASKINVATACPGVTLANDVAVKVKATQQASTAVVLATELECKVQGSVLIRPFDGTVTTVDATAKAFTVTLTGSATAQAVQWNDNTTFVGVTSTTLSGKTVRVEGYLSGTTLVARSVRLDDSSSGIKLDDDAFRTKKKDDASEGKKDDSSEGWAVYRAKRRS